MNLDIFEWMERRTLGFRVALFIVVVLYCAGGLFTLFPQMALLGGSMPALTFTQGAFVISLIPCILLLIGVCVTLMPEGNEGN